MTLTIPVPVWVLVVFALLFMLPAAAPRRMAQRGAHGEGRDAVSRVYVLRSPWYEWGFGVGHQRWTTFNFFTLRVLWWCLFVHYAPRTPSGDGTPR